MGVKLAWVGRVSYTPQKARQAVWWSHRLRCAAPRTLLAACAKTCRPGPCRTWLSGCSSTCVKPTPSLCASCTLVNVDWPCGVGELPAQQLRALPGEQQHSSNASAARRAAHCAQRRRPVCGASPAPHLIEVAPAVRLGPAAPLPELARRLCMARGACRRRRRRAALTAGRRRWAPQARRRRTGAQPRVSERFYN